MPEVSIVIVCMNRTDVLFPCLDSIRAHTRLEYETLVVAYMFSPENLSLLRERYPWVTVVESNELRGFSENNNLALRQARGKYCFVVNDDTWLEMPVIDMLVADFQRLPANVAAVCPKVVFPDGRVQSAGRAPWTMWRYMRHYVHPVDETRPSAWTMKEGLFRTYTLNGACFLARTDAFRQAGWFDETYTFTPEDIALGDLFNKSGQLVYCNAEVSIIHIANATASRMTSVIKPTRVRGSLIYYAAGSRCRYRLLASYVWLIEELKVMKYSILGHKEGLRKTRYDTARNVQRAVWSDKSPKEVFTELYWQLKQEK